MKQILIASPPFLLLVILIAVGIEMKKKCKFKTPEDPLWPEAENPGLALELADSIEFVDKVLGKAGTKTGDDNRKAARKFQQLDFVFIIFYVLFFIAAPLAHSGWSRGVIVVIVLAVLTGIFDVVEDVQILRMLEPVEGSSARAFGKTKWFFYFATLGAEGALLWFGLTTNEMRFRVVEALAIALVAIALGGIIASLKGSFAGIGSASTVSGFGLLALALVPLTALNHHWKLTAEYAVLMRVPLLLAAVLLVLPLIAFFTPAKRLLRGLFDLTPLSLFVVTLTTLAVAGTACVTAWIILNNAWARFHVLNAPFERTLSLRWWFIIMVLLGLPIIVSAVGFSFKEKHGLGLLLVAALSGASLAVGLAILLVHEARLVTAHLPEPWLKSRLWNTELFKGYISMGPDNPWPDHVFATIAFVSTLILYAIFGFYGLARLGKKRTVPALCSVLMVMLMLGWTLAAATFFLDAWRIPTLVAISLLLLLTAQSSRSDHFYDLTARVSSAPDPATTIKGGRVILVAASGGGIQAGAWTAQVLYGLHQDFPDKFPKSLRLISSVSGGSMGNAMFVHWLANKDEAQLPDKAAAVSSLDEVAWGLAWPDFLRAFIPWFFGDLIGRGRALERAWLLNSVHTPNARRKMDQPVSDWNARVAAGELPAVIMNATIAETGERLLFGTTQLRSRCDGGGALVQARELLTINDATHDVAVVTAARLSATFPYVTPASRAKAPGPQPHVVDGGYYDNYGMATMVEWLDEALTEACEKVKSVLVVQIHGLPVHSDLREKRHAKNRGWFYQAFAPLTTLAAVRDTGQRAHNDIELELLQQKWSTFGVPIHTVKFEFNNPDTPISWHLTPSEVKAIRCAWRNDMNDCRAVVEKFLNGSDNLECGCTRCKAG